MIQRRNDPFDEMRKRMNQMVRELTDMEDVLGLADTTRLPVDVEETEDQIIVQADMPGVDKDRIKVNVQGDQLSISATGEREVHEESKNYVRQERSSRQFSRSMRLPAAVDEGSAEATYEDGVLTVTLDKAAERSGTAVDVR